MKIENNKLYRSHYDFEPVATLLYPLDIYNDTTASLTIEQEQLLYDETEILKKFMAIDSVKKILQIKDSGIVPIGEFMNLLQQTQAEMKEKNIPVGIMDCVYSINDDGHPRVYMLPNNIFPITSIMALKNAKNSCIYDGQSNRSQRRWELVDNYESKIAELKDCKDEVFIAKQLAPLEKAMLEFDKENKEIVEKIKQKELTFNNYVNSRGLKEEFEKFEETQKILNPTVEEQPKKKTTKSKMKK